MLCTVFRGLQETEENLLDYEAEEEVGDKAAAGAGEAAAEPSKDKKYVESWLTWSQTNSRILRTTGGTFHRHLQGPLCGRSQQRIPRLYAQA